MKFTRSLIVEVAEGEFECTVRVRAADLLALVSAPLHDTCDVEVVFHQPGEETHAEKPRHRFSAEEVSAASALPEKPPTQGIGAGMGDTFEGSSASAGGVSFSDFLNALTRDKAFITWASQYLHSKGAMTDWIQTPSQVLNAYLQLGTEGLARELADQARVNAVNRYIQYRRSQQ